MKKTNTTSEIREYTTNIDEPIVISRSLLEKQVSILMRISIFICRMAPS